jgi:hypothetical protein
VDAALRGVPGGERAIRRCARGDREEYVRKVQL